MIYWKQMVLLFSVSSVKCLRNMDALSEQHVSVFVLQVCTSRVWIFVHFGSFVSHDGKESKVQKHKRVIPNNAFKHVLLYHQIQDAVKN